MRRKRNFIKCIKSRQIAIRFKLTRWAYTLTIYTVYYFKKGWVIMKEKKISLKKISKSEKSMVRTLACHCNCEGKVLSAAGNGYIGQFL